MKKKFNSVLSKYITLIVSLKVTQQNIGFKRKKE